MIADRLRERLAGTLVSAGQTRESAAALTTDFLRLLHKIMVKSGRNQALVLGEVKQELGTSTMLQLASLIGAERRGLDHIQPNAESELSWHMPRIFRERNFSHEEGTTFLMKFIEALHQLQSTCSDYMQSATVMTYWGIGHEAAYHLGGLSLGDHYQAVVTEFEYLDVTLRRFRKLVEMWEMENAWARDAEL